MRRFLLPAIITFIFILESSTIEFMPEKFFNSRGILVPHLLLIAILFLTIYGNRNLGILYGFIFGLLFDVVYTEIIGVYLVLFPIIAYLAAKLMKMLQVNILVVTLVSMLGVVALELGVYGLNLIIHKTTMSLPTFTYVRLIPTLLFNLVLTIIAAYPLAKFYEKLAKQMEK